MDRLERLIIRAKEIKEPHLTPWERAMKANPYTKMSRLELMDLLSVPHDDWRLIAQAMVWNGGG